MSTNLGDILAINESRLDYTLNGKNKIPGYVIEGRVEIDQVEVLLFISETINYKRLPHH